MHHKQNVDRIAVLVNGSQQITEGCWTHGTFELKSPETLNGKPLSLAGSMLCRDLPDCVPTLVNGIEIAAWEYVPKATLVAGQTAVASPWTPLRLSSTAATATTRPTPQCRSRSASLTGPKRNRTEPPISYMQTSRSRMQATGPTR